MLLELESLRFKGIGRFVDEQFIDFTKLGNLVQVDGENRNTKGSSGAAKTTVFNALDFLLGLNDLSKTVLQSRLTEDHIFVEGIFKYNGKPLKITRGKKLAIDENGKITTGSSDLTEAELDKILGMPRDIFRPMMHKRQKEGGFFLKLTPADLNKFLIDALDLSEEKKKLEVVEKRIIKLEELKKYASEQLAGSKGSLKATQDAILSLGLAPVRDMHPEVVQQLKAKADASRDAHRGVEAGHRLEVSTLENSRPQVTVAPYDKTRTEALEKGLKIIREKRGLLEQGERDRQKSVTQKFNDLKHLINASEREVADGNKAQQEATVIASEIKKIRASMCPTCEQGWVTDKAKEREAQLLSKINSLRGVIGAGAKASGTLASTLLGLSNLQEECKPRAPEGLAELNQKEVEVNNRLAEEKVNEQAHNRLQNENNKVTLDMFSFQQTQMRMRHQKELEQSYGQFNVDDKAHTAAYLKLKAHEEAKARYDSSIRQLKAAETAWSDAVLKGTSDVYGQEQELILAEESKRGIKSHISCSFDDALSAISDTATKIIQNIPNMANGTVQLEGVRETKDGKIKEEVNAVIHMGGELNIPIKSLSGGERSSVDLAVDLAVIDYIENKANKGINIFVLDEPFTGLDTVSIEMALEVLKNSNINKKLVLVDHNPEVKQMVQSRIVVVRDGQTSSIAA